LDDEQIEAIEGESDVAYNSELAHTSAQALLPMGRHYIEDDPETVKRILALVDDEGIDVLAETWVRSPEDSLPGILWRGYLLYEWIRRDGAAISERYAKAAEFDMAHGKAGELKVAMTPKPGTVRQEWNAVLSGTFEGDFVDVLVDSARFTDFLGTAESKWIESDSDPLATRVTRRDAALLETSKEFRNAAALAASGQLE
jgi:hypothetical protein